MGNLEAAVADSIKLEIYDKEVLDRFGVIASRLGTEGIRTLYAEIGEDLVESSKQRLSTSTGADGAPWKPRSP